jgi:hypothetical protein
MGEDTRWFSEILSTYNAPPHCEGNSTIVEEAIGIFQCFRLLQQRHLDCVWASGMPRSSPRAKNAKINSFSTPPGTPLRNTGANSAPSPPGSAGCSVESPVHKALRSLLLKHRRARKTWNQLVLVEGAQLGSTIVSLQSEMESVTSPLWSGLVLERAHKLIMDGVDVRTENLDCSRKGARSPRACLTRTTSRQLVVSRSFVSSWLIFSRESSVSHFQRHPSSSH